MRLQKIDVFLKYLSKIYFQNPEQEVHSVSFYSYLMNYGLNIENAGDRKLSGLFDGWMDNFKDKNNIKVFHSERQRRFLQFHNISEDSHKISHIKMYVPFNRDSIDENVKTLFGFIEENNIHHISKVSDVVRSDSVVLRVEDFDNANKIINYINENEQMKSSLMEVNPFLTNVNGIGLANDDNSSYNWILSNCLKLYFEDKKKKGFSNVGVKDFSFFIEKYYNDTFVTCEKLDSLISSEFFEKENQDEYPYLVVNNIRQVVKLLSENLKNENSLDSFSKHYVHCNNINTNNKYADFYNDNINKIYDDSLTLTTQYNNEKIFKKIEEEDVFDTYMLYSRKKHKTDEESNKIMLNYMLGNAQFIPEEFNFRNDFTNILTPDDVIEITENDNKITFNDRFNKKIRNNSNFGIINNYEQKITRII